MHLSRGYMRSNKPDEQLLPRRRNSSVDNKVEQEAMRVVTDRLLQILFSACVFVVLLWCLLPAHHASITDIAIYVMLGLNAVASRHQLALLAVKSVADSGTLNWLTRYFQGRHFGVFCRCFDAFSAALASLRFFGGLAAAVPQAVEEVKQQRLEEIRSEERKNSALKERSYSLTH